MKNNISIRNLENICGGKEFKLTLEGINYCELRMDSPNVECRYRASKKDKNDLFECRYDIVKQWRYLK